MASTFSPSLRIELVGDGDQSGIWGQTTNNNLGALIEQAIAGVVTINMVDTNYTMTNFNGVADEARNQVIVLVGTNTTQRNLIAPLVEKTYTVKNTTVGGFPVQIIGSSGVGVVIPNGSTVSVYCDGTDFYPLNTGAVGNFSVSGNLAVTGTSTFTGIPTGPTAAVSTNTTQLATTAFVRSIIPAGVILMWSGSIASIPAGWLLCNGTSGTPNLMDRFIVGAGSTYAVNDTGGFATYSLSAAQLPSHTHSISASGTTSTVDINHTHSGTTGTESANHVHGFSAQTGGQSNGHSHNINTNQGQIAFFAQSTGGGPAQAGFTGGVPVCLVSPTTSDVSADHSHSVSGNTGGISANHTHNITTGGMSANNTHNHTVTVTGTSGATGSGASIDNRPPYLALAYIMKA